MLKISDFNPLCQSPSSHGCEAGRKWKVFLAHTPTSFVETVLIVMNFWSLFSVASTSMLVLGGCCFCHRPWHNVSNNLKKKCKYKRFAWKLPQIFGSDMYLTLCGLVFLKNEMDEKVLAKIILLFYLLHYFEKITAKY